MTQVFVLGGLLQAVGGVESHVRQFCRLMANQTVDVSLVGTATKFPREWATELRQAGVKVNLFDCEGGWVKRAFGYGRCLTHLLKHRSSVDVFYTHGATGFAWLIRKVLGQRTYWVHHHHTDASPETLGRFSNRALATLREADQLIVCTPAHQRALDERFARGGRTVFLPYLKNEGRPPTENKPIHRPTVIGFFGVVRTSKGVPLLLESADWFRDHGFVCRIHGPDVEGLLKAPLPAGIEWAGPYHSDVELDRLLSSVDLVAIPSTGAEGLPLVFTEAISRGVPVVAFDGGGLKDMADYHPGVLVVPQIPNAFRAGLLLMRDRLQGDPSLARSLSEEYQRTLGNRITLDWWCKLLGRPIP